MGKKIEGELGGSVGSGGRVIECLSVLVGGGKLFFWGVRGGPKVDQRREKIKDERAVLPTRGQEYEKTGKTEPDLSKIEFGTKRGGEGREKASDAGREDGTAKYIFLVKWNKKPSYSQTNLIGDEEEKEKEHPQKGPHEEKVFLHQRVVAMGRRPWGNAGGSLRKARLRRTIPPCLKKQTAPIKRHAIMEVKKKILQGKSLSESKKTQNTFYISHCEN